MDDIKILAIGLIIIVVWFNSVIGFNVGFNLGALVLVFICFFVINSNYILMSLLFSIIVILTNSLKIVLGFDLFSFGQLAYFLTWFLLLPVIFRTLLIRLLSQTNYKLAAVLPLFIVLVGVGISFLIDPVKVDFYLYLNEREKAVTMIEAGQIDTVKQLIRNNHNEFHVRSVHFNTQLVGDEKEKQIINFIYLTRFTIGFGDGSRGYIYTKDEEYIAELNERKTKKLKDHWYWS